MARADVQAAIQAIADANRGKLTPRLVWTTAKADRSSPLHPHFTWTIRKAAEERWDDQARELIASVTVVYRTRHISLSAPVYVRDPSVPTRDQGYISIARLRTDEDMARDAVVYEMQRAAAALLRAKGIAFALGLTDQVEMLHRQVLDFVAQVRPDEPPGASA
jgi:hypothetical protein